MAFAQHKHESAMGIRVPPPSWPPPHPVSSRCYRARLWVPCIIHQTPTAYFAYDNMYDSMLLRDMHINRMVRVRLWMSCKNKRAKPGTSGDVLNGFPMYLTICLVNVVKESWAWNPEFQFPFFHETRLYDLRANHFTACLLKDRNFSSAQLQWPITLWSIFPYRCYLYSSESLSLLERTSYSETALPCKAHVLLSLISTART